ncbi:60S ribosomal protein L39-like [Apodemus sylvaticus]|uniref:60S ribosomal protein L39-like n=1 Tax=Apodemus sylvaticus TaxID=10129 RepID=UPI00224379B5|nr:60S ribosomal protein L39-like [Apodemus sylvaticus]
MSSHRTFRIKLYLAKKQKQNHPVPQWIQMKTSNKIRYNTNKRRHWKMKLGLKGFTQWQDWGFILNCGHNQSTFQPF